MSESVRKAAVRRPRRNGVMLVLSLALGAISVFGSKRYIEDRIAYHRGQLERTEDMVEVVVPNRAIRRGEILSSDMLSLRDIPARYADSNSVDGRTYDVALGQRVDFDIDEGRAVLWAHLDGGVSPTFSGKVPAGLRAMTVRVDDINSISGLLQPRDRVDLLLSHGSGSAQEIVTLIERLDVIATGVQTVTDKAGGGARRDFSTITVQVTPEQGRRITLARQIGTLTAMLRNPDDDVPLIDRPLDVARLLGVTERPVVVASAPVPEPRAARRATPAPPAIEYIIGGSR